MPIRERETDASPVAYLAPLRSTLIDRNRGHVNVVVCEDDYRALKCGIENLKPAAVGRYFVEPGHFGRSFRGNRR